MTPDEALLRLRQGNTRFLEGRTEHDDARRRVSATAGGQSPFAVILACADSRVAPEAVFDLGIGDAMVVRVAGNVLSSDILGSLEFACEVAGAKLLAVVGHSGCGAVIGACEGVRLGHLTGLLERLAPAVEAVRAGGVDQPSPDDVAEANVRLTAEAIPARSPLLAAKLASGEIGLATVMYDVATGRVRFL